MTDGDQRPPSGNRPRLPISAPVAKRHRLDAIGLRSPVKDFNSVAMPWIDMVDDVRLIREGWAERLPNDRWRINGRIYVRESGPRGTMYPESGDGIVSLTREQYRALTILQGYNDDVVAADFRLKREKGITEDDILIARDVLIQAVSE